jgi:hypothetical protein
MLKWILRDRGFNSNGEIEEAIASAWNDFTFDDVHSVTRKWISRFAWAFQNGREYTLEYIRSNFVMFSECENRKAPGTILPPVSSWLSDRRHQMENNFNNTFWDFLAQPCCLQVEAACYFRSSTASKLSPSSRITRLQWVTRIPGCGFPEAFP